MKIRHLRQGWDQRPVFDAMLRDATRRQFDVLVFWSIDRHGRSIVAVTAPLADLASASGQSMRARKPWMQLRRTDVQCCRWPQCSPSLNGTIRGVLWQDCRGCGRKVKALGHLKWEKVSAMRARLTVGDGMLKVTSFLVRVSL